MTEKPPKLANFFREVWRRHVLQVALPYCVVGWLLIEVSEVVLQAFEAPNWMMQTILIAFLVGLPIVVVLAWIFDLTPLGLVRTRYEEAQQAPAVPPAVALTSTPPTKPAAAPAMTLSLGESERRQVNMLSCGCIRSSKHLSREI